MRFIIPREPPKRNYMFTPMRRCMPKDWDEEESIEEIKDRMYKVYRNAKGQRKRFRFVRKRVNKLMYPVGPLRSREFTLYLGQETP